jgi:hypothetical protein
MHNRVIRVCDPVRRLCDANVCNITDAPEDKWCDEIIAWCGSSSGGGDALSRVISLLYSGRSM